VVLRPIHPRRWLPVALVGVLVLAGCAGQDDEEAGDQADGDLEETGEAAPAEGEEPRLHLVAKLGPLADLVEVVGGERVEVASLVPPGADSHTYEPRPSDVAGLADADAFIGIGLELNPGAVALAAESLPEDAVVLLGERYLDDDGLVFDHVHDEDGGHSHGDDTHTHGDEEETHSHGDDTHAHGDEDDAEPAADESGAEPGPNPHVWTSLRLASDLVDAIADVLSDLDPEGAEIYLERADEARTELGELDDRIEQAAATIPDENRTLVAYHDAWTYFARDYGLEMVTAVQPSDYAEPSAGDVRRIIDLIREHDVPALFGSEEFDNEVLAVIAEETGATYVGDLADDELPGEPGDPEHSYLGLMERNATMIVEHLGGDVTQLQG
jgi:ABC-type Zn uptake system ZnuABC Zn-binding protein ZnuA